MVAVGKNVITQGIEECTFAPLGMIYGRVFELFFLIFENTSFINDFEQLFIYALLYCLKKGCKKGLEASENTNDTISLRKINSHIVFPT